MIHTTAQAHFRPYLSANQGTHNVPITPPVWKIPLVEEMRSVASERVSSSKYLINEGCPGLVSTWITVPVAFKLTKSSSDDGGSVAISQTTKSEADQNQPCVCIDLLSLQKP